MRHTLQTPVCLLPHTHLPFSPSFLVKRRNCSFCQTVEQACTPVAALAHTPFYLPFYFMHTHCTPHTCTHTFAVCTAHCTTRLLPACHETADEKTCYLHTAVEQTPHRNSNTPAFALHTCHTLTFCNLACPLRKLPACLPLPLCHAFTPPHTMPGLDWVWTCLLSSPLSSYLYLFEKEKEQSLTLPGAFSFLLPHPHPTTPPFPTTPPPPPYSPSLTGTVEGDRLFGFAFLVLSLPPS